MNEMKQAWETFLDDADESALYDAITQYSVAIPEQCDYPYAHRISDLCLAGQFYRLIRVADASESIYILPCETPDLINPGVPYWLKGDKLRHWVALEATAESGDEPWDGEPTDWERFR